MRRRNVALFSVALAACGRRATEADCRLIVDKSVELGMREVSLAASPDIEKREQQVRAELQAELKSCEGRRVTERLVGCVQAANSTRELDECLR